MYSDRWTCDCGAFNDGGSSCGACGKSRRWIAILIVLALLVVGMLTFPSLRLSAAAEGQAECDLIINRNQVSVTVNGGACGTADFPAWCDAFVPRVIVRGQTIPCEVVVVVVTATPTRQPTPVPTSAPARSPTPVPLLDRLLDSIPVLGWSNR